MQQTEYYQLSLWNEEDRILMGNFNGDNEKIDAALHETMQQLTESTAQLSAAVEKCGNCRIETHSYTGTGTFAEGNPTHIAFSKPPLFFIILGSYSILLGSKLSAQALFIGENTLSGNTVSITSAVTWSGSKATFFNSRSAAYQMNTTGESYLVFAFFAADA